MLEDISMQTFSLTENNIIENGSKKEKNNILDEIYDVIHDTSSLIDELDKIIYNISNSFSKNIENLLNKIHQNLIIDNESYQKKEEYKNIIETIEKTMDEIKKICNVYEENKNKIGKIEEESWEKIIFLFDKIMILKNVKNNIDEKNENNMNDKKELQKKESSFLYKIKSGSIDLKSFNLFDILDNDNDNNNNYENADYPRLLRQNWQEICYIYDDYDIHDIKYIIKAIGFKGDQKAKFGYHKLSSKAKYEILSFYIDDTKSEYNYLNEKKIVQFDIDLSNLETNKVHIIYKQFFDYDALPADKIEKEKKLYRRRIYGLKNCFLVGQKCKYSLRLKGTFEIVDFNNYFLKRNRKNLNEKEYFWEGILPSEGKITKITFSKSSVNYYFNATNRFYLNNTTQTNVINISILFLGGNNEIIKIDATSPQTQNIILAEEKRKYIIDFGISNNNQYEFIQKGELKTKCKGAWDIDLTDEQIDNMIPMIDKLCIEQLKNIAENIIEEFDKNNKNSDYEFLDFMKIALWVHKNIKYDLNYSGRRDLTPIDVYKMRVGVCHHYTILCNALLYSLGYKVIFISGFCCDKISDDYINTGGHAWSLIKINNKWYPIDSTWGIISGKLPVSHVFGRFGPPRIINGRNVGSGKTEVKFKYNS